MAGEKGKAFLDVLVSANEVVQKIVQIIMYYAPIGLGCYFAALIGSFGASIAVGYLKTFVVYTLDFTVAASMENICKRFGIRDPEVIQMTVSKLTSKHTFQTQPSPWIISFKAGE